MTYIHPHGDEMMDLKEMRITNDSLYEGFMICLFMVTV